ncbi:biotin transporter BioY [Cohnella sp. CFH 77786]|uniref:biotin transporter BioY n=1 Tax=Cohnella sp. CFH 77786 TaxID=2662265 RepID=UPI001C60B181|nr:biotin transporter BioY [Cohnella sp. CFH 77786]MBW5444487.1 biotin transporter BioY [Cohnella sp. CFH 77786]
MTKPNPATPAPSRSGSSAADASRWIRGIVFVALFAALFIAASFVKSSPGAAVPYSLQTFAIMLAGGLLGAAYGFWSIFLVVALTTVGLPLMNGPGGFAQVFGPTGGFIWMFPVSALLIGWASDRLFSGRSKLNAAGYILLLLAMLAFGVLLVYVTGVPWLAHVSDKLDLAGAIRVGMIPFLPADTVKAVAATAIVAALRPSLPAVRPVKRKP